MSKRNCYCWRDRSRLSHHRWGPGATPSRGPGGSASRSSGVLPILNALGELSWTLLICILMIKRTQIMQGKSKKMAKLMKFMSFYAWKQVACFKYNLVLILFHYTATYRKLDGNWKISVNVIHFLSFACLLPVIFRIFSPSPHFFQARQKQKLPIKMTGMTGPS